jgi:hypothetical protein
MKMMMMMMMTMMMMLVVGCFRFDSLDALNSEELLVKRRRPTKKHLLILAACCIITFVIGILIGHFTAPGVRDRDAPAAVVDKYVDHKAVVFVFFFFEIFSICN